MTRGGDLGGAGRLARQLVESAPAGATPLDEAEREAMISGLVAGTLVAVRVETKPRLMDAPQVRPLVANGRELYGRFDAAGRWRSDDVPRGSCTVRLLDHPVLQLRKRPARPRVEPGRDDVVWLVGSGRVLALRAGEHHRIVVVPPPKRYTLSA